MADWQMIYTDKIPPTSRQIEYYIKSPLWQRLNERLQQIYKSEPVMEYSACSMQSGWNIKYKKSGKSLCTLYPMSGYFIALVVISAAEMHEAELFIHSCSDYAQGVFENTQTGNGQKWLMIDVREEATIEDVLGLIAVRSKTRNKSKR